MYVYDTDPPNVPMKSIVISNITSSSFVVQLDEMESAEWLDVIWWEDGSTARESITTQTSTTIRGLISNTKYNVIITAGNNCGSVANLSVTTLMVGSPVPILTMMTTTTTMSNSLTMSSSTISATTTPTGSRIIL